MKGKKTKKSTTKTTRTYPTRAEFDAKQKAQADKVRPPVKVTKPAAPKAAPKAPTTTAARPVYASEVHAAFKFYCSLQSRELFELRTLKADTLKLLSFLSRTLPNFRPIMEEGFDYCVVLEHRESKGQVTLLAKGATLTVCTAYHCEADVPATLRADLDKVLRQGLEASKAKGKAA